MPTCVCVYFQRIPTGGHALQERGESGGALRVHPSCCLSLDSPVNVSQMAFHLLRRLGKRSLEDKVSHGNPNGK